MDRRSALLLTMLLGGWLPRRLFAQSPGRQGALIPRAQSSTDAARRARRGEPEIVAGRDEPESSDLPASVTEPTTEAPPPALSESGQEWREFDISGYTALDHAQTTPQNALVEWIFRRTGSAPWHGEKPAVLSASRSKLRAYSNPKVLDQVAEVVDRFTDSLSDFVSIRVRFVAAVDTRWRYAVYSRLTPVGSGPQGQQIWTLKVEDSAFVMAQMQVYQGFRLLTDQKLEIVNGQTLTVRTTEPRGYTGGMARESAVGLGYQPKTEQLDEGVTLRFSPLLTYDGDALDAALELSANTVKYFHRTKVIAPREVGPSEITLDVPEVCETRLSQTVKGWPLGQTLLISGGIHPGILQGKGGFMNLRLPGTVPTGTELLVFLDAESISRPRRASARR